MATSTNYGWAEPDNSSLVKNGASDIRTLGNAVDASLWNVGYGNAGKNKIINGAFDFWQRGTSFNPSATGFFFFADRWRSYAYAASATTASQQAFTPGSAPVAGYEGTYFGRVVSTNTFAYFSYGGIENVRTFAGQEVTLSYWAKSASGQTLNEVQVSQYFGSSGSASVGTNLTPPTITTSWVRYTHTFTMPSISGKTISGGNDCITINIKGAINNALDIWGVQLEAGSTATPFSRNASSIQGELAACQRYYQRITQSTSTRWLSGIMTATSTSNLQGAFPLATTMRTTPTVNDYANVSASPDNISTGLTVSAVTLSGFSENGNVVIMNAAVTGATQYRPYVLYGNTTNAYIGFGAEL